MRHVCVMVESKPRKVAFLREAVRHSVCTRSRDRRDSRSLRRDRTHRSRFDVVSIRAVRVDTADVDQRLQALLRPDGMVALFSSAQHGRPNDSTARISLAELGAISRLLR